MRGWMVFLIIGLLAVSGCAQEEPQGAGPGEGGDVPSTPSIPSWEMDDLQIPDAELEQERCEDSDNGYDIHWRGTTTLFEEGEEKWVKMDYCLDSGTLIEYYCDNGALTHDSVKCVCEEGVCEPILDFVECVDSDGGVEKYIRGRIKLIKHYSDGELREEYPMEDHCISNVELIEYFCKDDGGVRKYIYTCLSCEDGACTR